MKKELTHEDLVKIISEYTQKNVELKDLPHFLDKMKEKVIFARGKKEGRILVLKRSGALEEFDDKQLYYSLIKASDSVSGYINDSDIKQITNSVVELIKKERPNNIINTKELRRMIEIQLQEEGFAKIAEAYTYY
ncbi:MAG: ATP cone domain-containing protein [Gallicola sp.]|nr:ATP cone domain-containing protein [Gallicola sp.]